MSIEFYDCAGDRICSEIFGHELYPVNEIGSEEQKHYSKMARHKNPLEDSTISELIYDAFCLIHSFDYYESDDIGEEDYKADVKAFKEKWISIPKEELAERIINNSIRDLEARLRKELGLDE